MGQKASTSPQTIASCREQLIQWGDLLRRGTSTGWRNFIKFNKGKCKVLHLSRITPAQLCRLGSCQLESTSLEKALGCAGQEAKHAINRPFQQSKQANHLPDCISKTEASCHRWTPEVLILAVLGMQAKEDFDMLELSQVEGYQGWLGCWSTGRITAGQSDTAEFNLSSRESKR